MRPSAAHVALLRLNGNPRWRVIIELDVAARAIIIERILPRGRAYDR
jgi:hypothetical protein